MFGKNTQILTVDSQKLEMKNILKAAYILKKGGLVAFPTETVYGLGADALNPMAVLSLFKAKKRPLDNPPIIHVGNIQDVYKLVKNVPYQAKMLMEKLWPGPLTLILNRSEIIPDVTVSGLDTVAIRIPDHNVALALLKKSGCFIAAPSANLAGKPSPTTAKHVLEDLNGRIDAVLDSGPTYIGVESTVLDATVTPMQILRPGGYPFEKLVAILEKVELHPVAKAEKSLLMQKPSSPGIKYKHYAPNAEMILIEGNISAVIQEMHDLIQFYTKKGRTVGVLATDETAPHYQHLNVKSLGSRSNLEVIAKNLFRSLREFDFEDVDIILAEGIPTDGLGLAVMNRLRKASGYQIVKVNRRIRK